MALRVRAVSFELFHKIPRSVQFSPPAKQSFQLSIPSRSRSFFQDFPTGFFKQYTVFPLHNRVYLSNKWNLINSSSISKHEDLHPLYPAILQDLFSLTPATLA